ncbi:hypothetical protein [Mucilaginibacter celer]|uniref:Uncharacterized protein n=1 Tax=Mucilaginibacter celer TaxID=2305508 RepID=A0A494W3Q9_9SPHI|nr:hypothetical protein [Mucilaginibacter celer]AYL98373.1 hypothetical protein HYN43_025170 [Mucilaginibacter celer]
MVVVLKKGATEKDIEAIEREIYKDAPDTGFDAKKYNGVISLKEDPMTIQTKLRNEWERDFS